MGQMSLLIVGVDHPNKDKSNRLFEILICAPGEEVHLVPEPKNPVDPQAVAVFSARHVQIGYVKFIQAQLVSSYMSRGRITTAIFQEQAVGGCAIRLGLDGEMPTLPNRRLTSDPVPDDDSGFWPDYLPPDD